MQWISYWFSEFFDKQWIVDIWNSFDSAYALVIYDISRSLNNNSYIYIGLHDNSANDDSAIDKMAARFWHTDDSATFLFEKKAKIFFNYPSRVSLKDFSYPLRVPERTYTTPHGVFLSLAGADFYSLKKLFLTPNWLQIGKNGLNWPSFFYM